MRPYNSFLFFFLSCFTTFSSRLNTYNGGFLSPLSQWHRVPFGIPYRLQNSPCESPECSLISLIVILPLFSFPSILCFLLSRYNFFLFSPQTFSFSIISRSFSILFITSFVIPLFSRITCLVFQVFLLFSHKRVVSKWHDSFIFFSCFFFREIEV